MNHGVGLVGGTIWHDSIIVIFTCYYTLLFSISKWVGTSGLV